MRYVFALAASLFLNLCPASATVVNAVVTGTILAAGDPTNIFGLGSTPEQYLGMLYKAEFTFNTSLGTLEVRPNQIDLYGGSSFPTSQLPILSSSLTINGITYFLIPNSTTDAFVEMFNLGTVS